MLPCPWFRRIMRLSTVRSGFTLIELSIVLVIIAVVLGASLATFLSFINQKGEGDTKAQLASLQAAFEDFRDLHGRLPCPADITLAESSANFGRESGTPGVCTPANASFGGGTVISGLVPVRSLGLTDVTAFDSWGSRITYVVTTSYTEPGALVRYGVDVDGGITVTVEGAVVPRSAVYGLVSFGPNRHGAYPRGGGVIRSSGRDPSAVQDVSDDFWGWEMINCGCDDGTGQSTALTNQLIVSAFKQDTADANDVYDDIVVFSLRSQLEKSDK